MQQSSNEELKNCIMQYKSRLQEILQRLEWSEEAVVKDFNTNSLASAVKENVKKPRSPQVATYPDSCITKNSLVIETTKLQEILQNNEVKAPRNFTELQANLSREQKLKIYEHVVENTEKLKNNTVAQVDEGEISLADILAQKKREEKRNKRKFRKPKPTLIEEVRCLVDLQMQALQQFVDNKMKKDEDSMERSNKHRGISRDERKHYEDYYKRDKYRDRSVDDYRRRDRNRSKERKRYHRSRSKDIAYERKKRSRSHSKERRKRSQSRHKDIVHKGTSNRRSHCNEISKDERKYCSSKEMSKERRKHRSRSKERRKPNRSCSKEDLNEKRKRSRSLSKNRKHSRSFSKEIIHKRTRHSRSHSKEIAYKRTRNSGSNEMPKERRKPNKSGSHERVSQREESFYSKKHPSSRDYENANEKRRHNEKQYRRNSKSPDVSGSKRHKTKYTDYDDENTSSHYTKKKQHDTSLDKLKYYRQSKSSYQSTEDRS